jgi:hypothetical protein
MLAAARIVIVAAILCALTSAGALARNSQGIASTGSSAPKSLVFTLHSGKYTVLLDRTIGQLVVTHKGVSGALGVTEIPGGDATNLLKHVNRISMNPRQNSAVISGKAPWAQFSLALSFRSQVLHWRLTVTATSDPGLMPIQPDVQAIHAHNLKPYNAALSVNAIATPIAGSSIFLGYRDFNASMLYFSNFTALGGYFDGTLSDPSQGNFTYPNASLQSLVGVSGSAFGYTEPAASLQSLPLHRPITIVDSYLVFASFASDGGQAAAEYLQATDSVLHRIPAPLEKAPGWKAIAGKELGELSQAQNWTSIGGNRYLRSYVSDQRSSPELITQLSVLLGLREYVRHTRHPSASARMMIGRLDAGLTHFYDPTFQTAMNSLVVIHDSSAQDESWYYVGNLISLMQLAKLGDASARALLMRSLGTAVRIAHKAGYVFPLDIHYQGLTLTGATQRDVAGGYAYLMLGLHDLTHRSTYAHEAGASAPHLLGAGFLLSYELHMTAYGAAASAMLFRSTHNPIYRRAARVALANFFHSVRLWDCTYGTCAHGRYHTYMGVNPLPWADYIAMREQYESWLGLRSFLAATAGGKHRPAILTSGANLARRFERSTLATLQYSLPPNLPSTAESSKPVEYSFVPQNRLDWMIPLEDLRDGTRISGQIGQEIYGAGGPLIFAALGN